MIQSHTNAKDIHNAWDNSFLNIIIITYISNIVTLWHKCVSYIIKCHTFPGSFKTDMCVHIQYRNH
jgi:hypothetical protein